MVIMMAWICFLPSFSNSRLGMGGGVVDVFRMLSLPQSIFHNFKLLWRLRESHSIQWEGAIMAKSLIFIYKMYIFMFYFYDIIFEINMFIILTFMLFMIIIIILFSFFVFHYFQCLLLFLGVCRFLASWTPICSWKA